VIIDEDGVADQENANDANRLVEAATPLSAEPKQPLLELTDDYEMLKSMLKTRSQDAGGLGELNDLIENYENERNLRFRIKRKQLFRQMVLGATDYMHKMDKKWHPNRVLIQKAISYLDSIKNHPNLSGHLSDATLADPC
jgi:hypothetical protein